MGKKEVIHGDEAREKILRGVSRLASVVKRTLGPRGRTVGIKKAFGGPHLTKDGVTVAKEIELVDNAEDMGAQAVREAAEKTASNAGDGTTTATVLTHAIFKRGLRNVVAGANPVDIQNGILAACNHAVNYLTKELAKPVKGKSEIEQVATISANGDKEIGSLIAEGMEKVGNRGTIAVESAKGTETHLKVVEGMHFDRGFISHHFITDQKRQEANLEEALVVVTDKKLGSLQESMPLLQLIVNQAKPVLIIAEDVEGEVLTTMILNKLGGRLKVCAVKAPGFGDRRKAMLQDIATVVGATFISEELGLKLDNVTIDQLGSVQRAIVSKDMTTLVAGKGDAAAIKERCSMIEGELEKPDLSDYDREKLQERLAKMAGGVAVIYVGAATEVEMKEKKDRAEDAKQATVSAVEEGIVPGGGVALIRCRKAVLEFSETLPGDQKTGAQILADALVEPARLIAENAGKEGSIIVEKIMSNSEVAYGYDARNEQFVNMLEAGILDPMKVVRSALENAASISGTLLTLDAVIVELPEEKPQAAGPAGPGAGDFDY